MLVEKSKYFIGFGEVRKRVICDVMLRSKKHTKGFPPNFSMRGEKLFLEIKDLLFYSQWKYKDVFAEMPYIL